VTVLLAIGVIEIYSASAIKSAYSFNDDTLRLRNHIIDISIGLAAMVVMLAVPPRLLQRLRTPMIGFALFLLILVLIPGIGSTHDTGARRWFSILGQSFQPSELAKLALLIFIASWVSERKDGIKRFHPDFTVLLGVVGATVFLVLVEPSKSAAAFIAMVSVFMVLVAGVRWKYLLPVGVGLILLGVLGLGVLMASGGYAKDRIDMFLNNFRSEEEKKDTRGKEYQSVESLKALTRGGAFGVGLGKGKQQLFFLPQSDSDFIFAIIAEEMGFVGASFVILLFIVFLFSAIKIAFGAADSFSGLLAIGLAGAIGLQAFIHIGVVTGSLILTGAPLPFITRGGTAMIFSLAAVGFIIGVANRAAAESRPPRTSSKRNRPKTKATIVRTKKPVVVKDFAEDIISKG
jgi:cell division protein FtsW